MIYGPTLLFSLGEGAVIPLIPVIATRLGADLATAAVVAGALVVGQLCGNIPAGWAVSRIGERLTMVVAGLVSMVAGLGLLFAPALWSFAVAVLLLGFCAAAFALARHSFMTTRVPLEFRARALSMLGGSFRLGVFVGPFVAAGLLQLFGTEQSAVVFLLACLVGLVLLVLLGTDPETVAPPGRAGSGRAGSGRAGSGSAGSGPADPGPADPEPARAGVLRTMWRYRGVLSRLGLAAATLSAARSARQVVLPLWGLSLGVDAQTIAFVVGLSGAIDFALFYASGQVMDRFGRLWAAMPAMLLMGAGFIALAFTHELGTAVLWFGILAVVLGIGNGLSSGILLTLGADTAPQRDPASFLGSWRTLTDAGGAVAPLIVSAVAAVSSLAVASGVIGGIALLGAVGFIRWVPRYIPRARP
ncbi:MFS transporter [Leucobacter sp. CSA1]|uniref:MFS transporter n=1 Tax=Leucobacter chromiisoli TaxID=2796471 RepID=A0A934Q9B5_9MICO|nr:MFS transporter [Leucobacter chromiisoli]MBK0419665.1 MFS transporter [Leucobacter chromiisoli]